MTDFYRVRKNLFGEKGRRGDQLWEWTMKGLRATEIPVTASLPEVDNTELKLLNVLWTVLIDDIADEYEISRASLILPSVILGEVSNNIYSKNEKDYIELIFEIGNILGVEVKKLPSYSNYKNWYIEEFERLKLSFTYSFLIRTDPENIDINKYIYVLSSNMQIVVNGIYDLMSFNDRPSEQELADIRKILGFGQRMARIINSINSFEKEVVHKDFSSEIILWTCKLGLEEPKNLGKIDSGQLIQTIKSTRMKDFLIQMHSTYYSAIKQYANHFSFLNFAEYLKTLDKFEKLQNEYKNEI
ncbi:hypothetical protein KC717_03915 [Candidatus Dojkabacteria bacterium]|uniref:Uncharacterized protein n=1 Tax=Candidatus Dojkabacteria bacterium TaxID=2099670 RepID=A0A955RKV0_9BACT|nr:hypothetical protein [Candidatus Dojkabacteria bacterium]